LKECLARIKRIEEKSLVELFNNPNPSPKINELLDQFLEVWKIKVQKITYE